MLLNKKHLPVVVAILIIMIVGLFILFKSSVGGVRQPLEIQGIYFSQPNLVNPFELKEGTGKMFTDQNLRGRYTLLFFGFTYCPDICPVTLATLDTALKAFKAQYPDLSPPQVVFVSVDPERDAGPRLSEYVAHFNPDFIGVTGSELALKHLTEPMGVVFDKIPDSENGYLVEHSTAMMLVNTQGEWVAVLTPPFHSDSIVKELVKIYQNEKGV